MELKNRKEKWRERRLKETDQEKKQKEDNIADEATVGDAGAVVLERNATQGCAQLRRHQRRRRPTAEMTQIDRCGALC